MDCVWEEKDGTGRWGKEGGPLGIFGEGAQKTREGKWVRDSKALPSRRSQWRLKEEKQNRRKRKGKEERKDKTVLVERRRAEDGWMDGRRRKKEFGRWWDER